MPSTVNLHRVLSAPPERVYRAFLDADALVKWLPPDGFTAKVTHMDAKVGGGYKMSFTNFTNGESQSFGGEFLELIPNQFIKYVDRFDDPNLAGEILVTINLEEVMCGTDIKIIQAGIPDEIPIEMCYVGWQQSLDTLAKLVEPEISE